PEDEHHRPQRGVRVGQLDRQPAPGGDLHPDRQEREHAGEPERPEPGQPQRREDPGPLPSPGRGRVAQAAACLRSRSRSGPTTSSGSYGSLPRRITEAPGLKPLKLSSTSGGTARAAPGPLRRTMASCDPSPTVASTSPDATTTTWWARRWAWPPRTAPGG